MGFLFAQRALFRIGDYEVLERIARGGMGTVYLARQRGPKGFSKLVAIKRLHPHLDLGEEARRRFVLEARIGAALSHPNIVSVLGLEETRDELCIVMEYVRGCTLAELLAARASQPIPHALCALVVRELLCGLDAAHTFRAPDGALRPVIHRDLKPSNLLLSTAGEVKVTDFGIASHGGLTTQDGSRLRGTLAYMAPEQARAQAVDARADLYAAGLLLYELASGERGNPGTSEIELLQHASRGTAIERIRQELPDEIRVILRRALAPVPAERYEAARTFRSDIDQFLYRTGWPTREDLGAMIAPLTPAVAAPEDRPGMATRATLASSAGRSERRERSGFGLASWRKRVALVLGAVACAVAGVALFGLRHPSREPAKPAKRSSGAARSVQAPDSAALPRAPTTPPAPANPPPSDAPLKRSHAVAEVGEARVPSPIVGNRSRQPSFGVLVLNTVPHWSAIWIDGRASGTTPLRLRLRAGQHDLVIRPLGAGPALRTSVWLRARRTTTRIITVTP